MSLLFPIILMLLRISPCFGLGGSLLYIDFMKRHTYWFCPNGIPSIEIILEKQLYYTRTFSLLVLIRHFSHVVKSRIFKNLNLKRKAVRNFRGNLLKSHFRHLNSYSNLRSWLTRGRWHMSNFSKTKVEVHIFEMANFSGFATWEFTAKGDLNPWKQVFLLNLRPWHAQKPLV